MGYRGKIIPVVSAGSDARQSFHGERKGGGFVVVSKINMIGSINVMAQYRQLEIVGSDETRQLFKEMAEFQMRRGERGRTSVTAAQGSDGSHGDLVVSLGLACYFWLNRGFRQLAIHC